MSAGVQYDPPPVTDITTAHAYSFGTNYAGQLNSYQPYNVRQRSRDPDAHHIQLLNRAKRRHIRRWHMRGWFALWVFVASLVIPVAIAVLAWAWRWALYAVLS